MIRDLYCDMAQYHPRQNVKLIFLSDEKCRCDVSVYDLDVCVLETQIDVEPDGEGIYVFDLGVFPVGGYGVQAAVNNRIYQTAFDVAEDVRDYPRCGFLSDFSSSDNDSKDIENMAKYHINTVQFYDWMYRHHDLIPKTAEFEDALGRKLNLHTVLHKIKCCHDKNMATLAYAAIFGAEKEYVENHPEQVMYRADGKPFDMIGKIFMMNYDAEGPWSDHIASEFNKALDIGFDGLHLDQYGYPKFAHIYQSSEIFNAEDAFKPFINKIRAVSDAHCGNDKKPIIYFNSVNNWPVYKTADAKVDAVYIEVWNPFDSYFHLVKIIDEAKRYGGNKPVVLSAYLKPFSKKENVPKENAQACFRLATAAIYSSGGFHLVLGEYQAVLQDAYYADYGSYGDDFAPVVRRYYDYIVRYRDLFHDKELENVSMNYSGGIIGDYYIENIPVSSDARAGTVWISVRKKKGRKLINLINLLNQKDALWNTPKCETEPCENLSLVLLNEPVESIYYMTPDGDDMSMKAAEYEIVPHYCGKAYRITLPRLDTWSTVLINEL